MFYNDSELRAVLLNRGSSGTIKAGASGSVSASDVNLRRGAGTNYSVVTRMNNGTKLTFVDGKLHNKKTGIRLSSQMGKKGYIHKDYVTVSGGSRNLNNVNKQKLVNALLQYHHAAGSCYWGLFVQKELTRWKHSSTAIMTVTVSTIITTSISRVTQTRVSVFNI